MQFSRYFRLFVCFLLTALMLADPSADLSAKRKRSRKARTSKQKKKSRKRSRRKSRAARVSRLPVVVLGSTDPIDAPEPFVTLPSDADAPDGLDGRTIAIWPSHGKYFSGSWNWQRPRLFGTVEDLFSRSFVDPYIVPMLENAGAYVMMPRERDFSTSVTIIDNNGSTTGGRFVTTSGKFKWEHQPDSSGYALQERVTGRMNPFLTGTSGKVSTVEPADSALQSTAQWFGTAPEGGERAVYVSYQSYPNSATDATYTVNHLGGPSQVVVNQQMGGGTWVYIGTYPFTSEPSDLPLVMLSNISEDKEAVVSADAVRIGGGRGIVARSRGGEGRTSGYPAYLEGARYYLQAAGFPEKVYTPENGSNDYMDDYKSRAHWVNYLTGGSVLYPDTTGLNVPVDLALAFHTDAGLTTDSTTVGTLGLYSTDDGNPLGNGTSRYANRDLTRAVTSQVVGDIRKLYDPRWSSRSYSDKKYFEVRETKVPAMIIEMLSHQNFEDMKRGLDPHFRFIVGRAVYKGILKFLAGRYNHPYVVQPLPVEAFAIRANGHGRYTLSWQPVEDPIEPTATPTSYIIYEATPDRYFHPVATVENPYWTTTINDDKIHAYYVAAANDGGTSFPSEVLTLYDHGHRIPSVEIVNGYTRVAGPEWVDGADYAGFDFSRNYGVPDGRDVHYIGSQFDFDPNSRQHGSSMGFGECYDSEASFARLGNEFDYTVVHGEAIRKSGHGFISSSLKAFEQSDSAPAAVYLILGLQKTTRRAGSRDRYFMPFTPQLQQRLAEHRRRGGALLVSGSYLSSEILEADSVTKEATGRFASEVLGYAPFIANPTDSIIRTPVATSDFQISGSEIIKGMPVVKPTRLASFKNGRWAGAGNPQAITAADTHKGLTIARYNDTGYPAAIAVEGDKNSGAGRTVVASFPIEAMEDNDSRDTFLASAVDYLIGPDKPAPEEQQKAAKKKTKKQLQKEAKEKAAREKAARKAAKKAQTEAEKARKKAEKEAKRQAEIQRKGEELQRREAEAAGKRSSSAKGSSTVKNASATSSNSASKAIKAVPHRRR